MSGVPGPEVRVGDAERAAVEARLSRAFADGVLTAEEHDERVDRCWAARTRGDLDALVRDLPGHAPTPAPGAQLAPVPGRGRLVDRRRARLAALGVGAAGAVALAVVGGGVVAPVLGADDGASVFGSRVVQVGPDQDRVDVGTLFGSVRVVVPDDARVRTSGTVVFGSLQCRDACDGTGTRDVVVDAVGGFGSVNVVRQGETTGRGG